MAYKASGALFEINTPVLAVDMNGNVAEGKVKDSSGNFEVTLLAQVTSSKKTKGLGGNIIIRVGGLNSTDFLTSNGTDTF